MARTPTRKTSKAKATAQRGRATPATKARAKRYTATPSGTSDRKHLIGLIQNTTGCSSQRARETLNSLLGTIGASLKKNQKVQLTGFGSFVVSKRRARKARNPRTGEAIRVKASKSVRFRPGQTLKRSLQQGRVQVDSDWNEQVDIRT
ncbi:MAG: HU family DNA-binding protein [Nitrospiraceae bacterium]